MTEIEARSRCYSCGRRKQRPSGRLPLVNVDHMMLPPDFTLPLYILCRTCLGLRSQWSMPTPIPLTPPSRAASSDREGDPRLRSHWAGL